MNGHPHREIGFHLTLTEEDRELLDRMAHRMGCSRTEAISRALHHLEAARTQRGHQASHTREEPTL